nr:hypothetical protein [Candidatus Sigynarchaeota archaeon]
MNYHPVMQTITAMAMSPRRINKAWYEPRDNIRDKQVDDHEILQRA